MFAQDVSVETPDPVVGALLDPGVAMVSRGNTYLHRSPYTVVKVLTHGPRTRRQGRLYVGRGL